MSALRERPRAATWFDGFSDEDTVQLVPVYRARVSALAAFSLILGLIAVSATFTGLLAPEGVALGALAVILAIGGMAAPRRREITGRSLAVLGFLCGAAAGVIGALAILGRLPWLDSHTNEVSQLHDWLNTRLPWLRHW